MPLILSRLFVLLVSITALIAGAGAFQSDLDAARGLISEGRVVEALQKLEALQKQYASSPDAQLAIGELFQELAAQRAEELQRIAPDSAAAHQLLGKSLEARGKLKDALVEYQRGLSSNSNLPGLHSLAGGVERKLGDLQAARADFADELRLNPHHATANLRMGEIVLEQDRDHPERAIPFLREATADEDGSIEAHRQLGKALRLAHRYDEALTEFKLVETRRPNDDSVHAQLAALYRDRGDSIRAAQEMEVHARILREKLDASKRARGGESH